MRGVCNTEVLARARGVKVVGTSIRIGVSSCLLGVKTRYDGGHKFDSYLSDVLGRFFTAVGVCPEAEAGMPTPREPMRLHGDPGNPRLITNETGADKTGMMLSFCARRVEELELDELSGFVLKKNSPTCGPSGVAVIGEGRNASGSGLFARVLRSKLPHLPVEDEARLADPAVRENFVERIFGYRRWRDFLLDEPDPGKLVEFHTRNKLVLMSHSTALYRETGRVVAQRNAMQWSALLQRYEELFMTALQLHATVRKHTNVLQHVMGYFKNGLCATEKDEMLDVIDQFHQGLVPLIVPVTLLNHYVHRYDQQYLQQQYYLFPNPAELMLRNHA